MGPWYYEVVSFDGDYVNLRRTDIESDELNPVALALRKSTWAASSSANISSTRSSADKTKRRPFGRRFCIF